MTASHGIAQLDNPFHSALRTLHRGIALQSGQVVRYPAAYAPFLAVPDAGVPDAGVEAEAGLHALVAPGESVYLLGVAPARVPPGWRLEALRPLVQMVCETPLPVMPGPAAVELGEAQRGDVLALTARVYPHYFRERTLELGRYLGIYRDGRLAAMAGERLGADGFREMSAICTDPDFLGQGYARRLTALLGNINLAAGVVPFLHVSRENPRALQLYARMGYRHRRDIGFWALHAPATDTVADIVAD